MEDKLTVLVVDDEPFNVDYLIQELEDYGVNTISAADGIEALEQINQHLPDLILLDIMMPKMDGFEVLAKLKATDEYRDIPVVIISAHSDMQNVLKGIEMGAEDYLPKPFDPLLLKARVNASFEKKRFRNLEKKYLESIERELHIGRDIQADFLPEKLPSIQGWDIAAFFQAAKEVSGDFYDVYKMPDGKIGLALGDVTDKGVGSALYMALYRSFLRASMLENLTPLELTSQERLKRAVVHTNSYICNNHAEPRFLTLFTAILNPENAELHYISAGHDHPFLVNSKGELTEIIPTGPIIGIMADVEFEVETISFNSGSLLFIYTDGVTDLLNAKEESFGRQRLLKIVSSPTSSKNLIARLEKELEQFSGESQQFDDITLLALQRN